MTTESPLLAVENVHVHYGHAAGTRGRFVRGGSVVGARGARRERRGQDHVARLLAGFVKPSTGRVVFDGHDLTGMSPHRIARLGIAWVPEGRGIFPGLSVQDNLRARLRHVTTRSNRADALARAFEQFPVLRERRGQRAATLSGGEQQMLALARVARGPPSAAHRRRDVTRSRAAHRRRYLRRPRNGAKPRSCHRAHRTVHRQGPVVLRPGIDPPAWRSELARCRGRRGSRSPRRLPGRARRPTRRRVR